MPNNTDTQSNTRRGKAPIGWSKAGAARLGREWRPMAAAQCYYCGQEDCDCGGIPTQLQEDR